MRTSLRTAGTTSAAVVLLLTAGCGGSDPEIRHPVDAAQQMLDALGAEDTERVCGLVADPETGPVPESMLAQCEVWASDLVSHLGEGNLEALKDSRVATVTLTGEQEATVLADDYEVAPPSIPTLDLIEVNDQWFVQDVSFQ